MVTLAVVIAGAAGCAGEGETPSDGAIRDVTSACPNSPTLLQVAPACNTVANSAPPVPFKSGTGPLPSPFGGQILDGLYMTTSTAGWGAVTPAGRRATLAILNKGTRFLWHGEVLDAEGENVALSYRVVASTRISGTQIEFSIDCSSVTPSPVPPTMNFTGGGAELQLMHVTGGDVAVTSYTRTGCP